METEFPYLYLYQILATLVNGLAWIFPEFSNKLQQSLHDSILSIFDVSAETFVRDAIIAIIIIAVIFLGITITVIFFVLK